MTRTARTARARSTKRTSSPSEIAPGVFVGGWSDAVGFHGTRLCVLDEAPKEELPGELHLPIYQEGTERPIPENLDRLVGLVEAARARDERVLLFCGHGVRRGPLAGAWYLHRQEGLSLDAAYDRVRAVRPQTQHVKEWAGDWRSLADA
ncbi:MAG: dual specificity protein phosphatase [Thermoplasmata archaeon]